MNTAPANPTDLVAASPAHIEHPFFAEKKWLSLPVKNGGPKRVVELWAGGEKHRWLDIELAGADEPADWHAFIDIALWRGRLVQLRIHPPAPSELTPADTAQAVDSSLSDGASSTTDVATFNARLLARLHQRDADTLPASEVKNEAALAPETYREVLRPQFHFSSKRGWLNDPNGLVYHNGEYHLFYQHNPYGTLWGNMHWGHAVSTDLVRWRELDIALYPDRFGTMFSGCAVVDWHNTSGLARDGKPPLILLYTAAGDWVQCLAYSHDGRTFTKLPEPVVPKMVHGNRDPKVIWHAPSSRWIMVLYAGTFPDEQRVVQFLVSTDLKNWKPASEIKAGPKGDAYLYECPDFFELPIDGNLANTRWVLMAGNSAYALGSFDGVTFKPEISRLNGQRGRGFFAAQTFSDEPNGRRIEIGWCHTHTHPSMPFNQSMSLPMELKLQTTTEGVRLTRSPVSELASLRHRTHELGAFALGADLAAGGDVVRCAAGAGVHTLGGHEQNAVNSADLTALERLAGIRAELLEIHIVFRPASAREVRLDVRGISIVYDADRQELVINDHRARALLDGPRQALRIFTDRIGLEIFAGQGEVFVPFPINLDPSNLTLDLSVVAGDAQVESLTIYELNSAWR